jgi:primosomal protein N' (replication factor Y)
VLLGSATPSLESWQRARSRPLPRLALAQRIGGGAMPRVRLLDMGAPAQRQRRAAVLAPPLLDACRSAWRAASRACCCSTAAATRRCCTAACGWKSGCPHCSAWRVFHKATARCAATTAASPSACRAPAPTAATSTSPLGPRHREAGGAAGRTAARRPHRPHRRRQHARQGQLEQQLAGRARRRGRRAGGHADGGQGARLPPHHAGGGHQPRRRAVQQRLPRARTPVCAADAGRRPRRARRRTGRAQRDVGADLAPHHPLYQALVQHDYAGLRRQPARRARGAGLPPFSRLALLRAEARDAAVATAFLQAASALARDLPEAGVTSTRRCRRRHQGGRHRAHADAGGVGLAPGAAAHAGAWLPAAARAAPRHKGWCAGRWTWTRWRSDQAGRTPNSQASSGEADEGQHRAAHDDARHAAVVGAVALGQQRHVAGAGQGGGQHEHHELEARQRRAQLPRASPSAAPAAGAAAA